MFPLQRPPRMVPTLTLTRQQNAWQDSVSYATRCECRISKDRYSTTRSARALDAIYEASLLVFSFAAAGRRRGGVDVRHTRLIHHVVEVCHVDIHQFADLFVRGWHVLLELIEFVEIIRCRRGSETLHPAISYARSAQQASDPLRQRRQPPGAKCGPTFSSTASRGVIQLNRVDLFREILGRLLDVIGDFWRARALPGGQGCVQVG